MKWLIHQSHALILPSTHVQVLELLLWLNRAIDLMIINNTINCYTYGSSKKKMDLHETLQEISLGFGKGKKINSEYQASFHFRCY